MSIKLRFPRSIGDVIVVSLEDHAGPKQFEGRFSRYDRERKYIVKGAMVYDATQKRVSEFEDEDIAGKKQALLKLKLYNEGKEYILDLKTRKCNVTAPSHPFHNYGVPPNAVYKAEAVIGATGVLGESVLVANFEDKGDSYAFFVDVTQPHCFPVGHTYFSKDGLEQTNFYDLQEGITKPDAFDIPKECSQL